MKNIDYNVLEKVMKVYQGMPNNQKMVMEASAAEAWQSAFREYTRLCTHDEELVRMQNEIHKIENALRFDMEDYFPASRRGMTYHDITTYDEARYLSEHWIEISTELEQKIEKAEKSIFRAFNKTKVEELKKELRDKRYIVQRFESCCAKQKIKEEYERTLEQVYEPLKKKYDQKVARYARKVVKKCIEENPFVICKKHKVIYTASNEQMATSTRVMNEICNTVREKVVRALAKQELHTAQQSVEQSLSELHQNNQDQQNGQNL